MGSLDVVKSQPTFYHFGVSLECPVRPIKRQSCPHIETTQLICTAIHLTGFYMSATLAFNRLNE